jgi:hypothetical protein
MKRSYRGVFMLCAVLMLNIAFTQYAINHYYFENYRITILFVLLNIALFPAALWIYKKEKHPGKGEKGFEK